MKKINPYAKGETPYNKYPSWCGSHASMIDEALTEALNDPELVVLRDEHKEPYMTSRKVLDNGMADPNRYAAKRLEYLCHPKDA